MSSQICRTLRYRSFRLKDDANVLPRPSESSEASLPTGLEDQSSDMSRNGCDHQELELRPRHRKGDASKLEAGGQAFEFCLQQILVFDPLGFERIVVVT